MRKDPVENKARVPTRRHVEGKWVRVAVLRSFQGYNTGQVIEMEEGRELEKLIRESMVRPADAPDEPGNAGS